MEQSNDAILDLLEDVEFCNMETGEYFRAVAIHQESTGPVVIIEKTN